MWFGAVWKKVVIWKCIECWLWIPFVEWVLIRAVILRLKVVSNSMWSIKISFGFYLLLDIDMVETLGITDAWWILLWINVINIQVCMQWCNRLFKICVSCLMFLDSVQVARIGLWLIMIRCWISFHVISKNIKQWCLEIGRVYPTVLICDFFGSINSTKLTLVYITYGLVSFVNL